MINVARLADLHGLTFSYGAHKIRADGTCAMEAAAWLAGEPHSDSPACTCPVIAEFIRTWNDGLPKDADRRRLLGPLVVEIVGTRNDALCERRALMALDWVMRVQVPAWMRLSEDLRAQADVIRLMLNFRDANSVTDAGTGSLRDKYSTFMDEIRFMNEIRNGAQAAAWDASGDVVKNAAGLAAWSATWEASEAAWDELRYAIRQIAKEAARDPDAEPRLVSARIVLRDSLRQTVVRMQSSAVDLVRRMCALSDGQHDERDVMLAVMRGAQSGIAVA